MLPIRQISEQTHSGPFQPLCPAMATQARGGITGLWPVVDSQTYPFTIEEQMSPEDHGIIDGHLFVPVQDLEDPAVHGALVDAG